MIHRSRYDIHALWCKVCVPLLAFNWCAGLLLGMHFAAFSSPTLASLVRNAAGSIPSIIGSVVTGTLPFLISALAVKYHRPMLLPICFTKGFSFSFCGYGIGLTFGQSSWLVRPLFLFSDCCIVPVLYLYWLRNIHPDAKRSWKEFWLCIVYAVCVGCVDRWFVSPFLATLIR